MLGGMGYNSVQQERATDDLQAALFHSLDLPPLHEAFDDIDEETPAVAGGAVNVEFPESPPLSFITGTA